MYLIPVSELTDNDLCLLHDGKQATVVNPVNAGLAMAMRNVHGRGSKSILVTHHQGGFITPISPGNSQCVVAGVNEPHPTQSANKNIHSNDT